MSERAQFITSIATLVAALSAAIIGWRNSIHIEAVRHATNGLTSQLVTASTAQGNLEGRAELKQEQQAP